MKHPVQCRHVVCYLNEPQTPRSLTQVTQLSQKTTEYSMKGKCENEAHNGTKCGQKLQVKDDYVGLIQWKAKRHNGLGRQKLNPKISVRAAN